MKQLDLTEVVSMIVAEAGDDLEKAESALDANPSASSYLRRLGYQQALSRARHEANASIKTMPPQRVLCSQVSAKRAKAMRQGLWTLYTVRGVPLGRTTPEMLMASVVHLTGSKLGLEQTIAFHTALANAGRKGVPMQDSLTIEKAEEIRLQCFLQQDGTK